MRYLVTTHEEEVRRYSYEVEADSKEEAKEKVRSGEAECIREQFCSGEILDMEVENEREDDL